MFSQSGNEDLGQSHSELTRLFPTAIHDSPVLKAIPMRAMMDRLFSRCPCVVTPSCVLSIFVIVKSWAKRLVREPAAVGQLPQPREDVVGLRHEHAPASFFIGDDVVACSVHVSCVYRVCTKEEGGKRALAASRRVDDVGLFT